MPASYSGQSLKALRVNAGETELEFISPSGSGTVTTVSVVTNAGISGSVANPTTTPAITLSVATQSAGDNTTNAATTAFVKTAVDNAIAGVNPAVTVQAATTVAADTSAFVYNNGVSGIGATLTGPTANVAVTIDGYTFTAVGQRLLVKNDTQSPSGAFNGVYFLTTLQAPLIKPVFTRALDYDMPSDINNTGAVPVVNGTVNALTSWLLTSLVTTVGTDPLTYTEFSFAPVSAANPSATASNTAVNGTAATYMRSDAAPAVQLGSASVKGVVQVDGTTITASGGVLTATGAGSGSPTGNTLSAEILADVPTGYWKCNDTSGSTIVDSSGNGFDLTVTGTPTLAYAVEVPTETASFLRIKGTGDGASLTSALGTSPPLTGDISFCCIVTPESLITNHNLLFSLGLNSSETEANNIQFYAYLDIGNSGRLTVFWENGAGTDTNVAQSQQSSQLPVLMRSAMWHAVKDGTAKTVTFYRNGVLMGNAVSYTNNPTGGTGSIQARIGFDGTLSTGTMRIAHVAFFNAVKLTAARVWAHARAAGMAGNQ